MWFPLPNSRMILPVSFIAPVSSSNHVLPCKRFPHEDALLTAKIRNHEQILKQAEVLKEEEMCVLQYHRQCYQESTHKSSLNVLRKKHEKPKDKFQTMMQNIWTYETNKRSVKPKRASSSSSSSTLFCLDKCIFCDKTK